MSRAVLIARDNPDPDPPPPPGPDPFPPPQPPLPDPQPPTPPTRPPIPQLSTTSLPLQATLRKEDHMHTFPIIGLSLATVMFTAVCASANPSMLPKHEGYPMGKATDPVTGKSLSNDPGQTNATGTKALEQAAMVDDQHSRQNLTNENDKRVLEKPGAGLLPKVQGPQIKIEPPVKEATKTQANPGQ